MRKKICKNLVALGTAVVLVTGCAAQEKSAAVVETDQTAETTVEVAQASEDAVIIDEEAVPLYSKPAGSKVRVPSASGAVTYGNTKVTIDASNTKDGYVMVQYSGSNAKIKVQISKSGSDTYTYDLNARSAYEVFPLTDGSGTYSVKVFENASGNQYSQAFGQDVSVSLSSEFAPFLYPNQYVNFTSSSAAVQKGSEVAASATDQIGVVTNIYNYVIKNVTYDTAKANSVKSGYLPNVDQTLSSKKGICFDYAALMTAMLRSQDIPAKLVVGYTGNLYHAWVNVYIDNMGWVDNMIYFDGTDWKLMDPTFASNSGQSEDIMKYIGDNANYQKKYAY